MIDLELRRLVSPDAASRCLQVPAADASRLGQRCVAEIRYHQQSTFPQIGEAELNTAIPAGPAIALGSWPERCISAQRLVARPGVGKRRQDRRRGRFYAPGMASTMKKVLGYVSRAHNDPRYSAFSSREIDMGVPVMPIGLMAPPYISGDGVNYYQWAGLNAPR